MRIAVAILASLLVCGSAAAQEGMGDECEDAFRGISETKIAWDGKLFGVEGPAYNATSFLADKAEPLKYHELKAFDGRIETAWVEGKPDAGINEKLAFLVKGNAKSIQILPGYGLKEYFKLNNRVETAVLTVYRIKERYNTQCVSGIVPGEIVVMKELYFKDEMQLQSFELNLAEKEELVAVLEIASVYEGSRWNDTCVAEIVIK